MLKIVTRLATSDHGYATMNFVDDVTAISIHLLLVVPLPNAELGKPVNNMVQGALNHEFFGHFDESF